MSDTVVVALITGGSTGLVGLAALAFNFWSSSRERELRLTERREDYGEWYKRTLFEKRLQVAQEAYAWLMKFNRGINLADAKDPNAEWNQELARTCLKAREWYDDNAAFFYDSFPGSSEFLGLINAAAAHSACRGEHLPIWDFYQGADREIKGRLQQLLDTEQSPRRSEDDH